MPSSPKQTSMKKTDSDDDPSIHSNILRVQNKYDVFKKYELMEVLVGSGSMGTVSKVRIKERKIGGSAFTTKSKGVFGPIKNLFKKEDEARPRPANMNQDSHIYALKSILLDRVSPLFVHELKNEISILRSMDHPNIVKAHEVFICKNKQIYIVLELCDGGDLYDRQPYSEAGAARIVAKLCSAISYMHEHKIVHRDLKFENIMFENMSENAEIKVIDFGLSKKFQGKAGYMTERVGTIYTMAPQVLQGVYSSQADLWSIGVISYMLLSSSKPFYDKRRRRMIDLIMRGAVTFDEPVWELKSEDSKDFCRNLIVVDPRKRLTAPEAMKHSWIVNREQLPDDIPSEDVLSAIDDCLLNYRQTSQLKKLALTMIAHRSTTEEILQLRNVFDTFDTSKNGTLSFEEFKAALEKMNYSDAEMDEIFSSIDLNQNGHIMYTEFLAATIEAHGHIEEYRIAEAFDRIDSDDTGYISRENLREVLGKNCPPEEVDAIMAVSDKNNDGKISYAEFLETFREQTHSEMAKAFDDTLSVAGSSNEDLLGLDAKIPGGRFDSDLSPSLQKQIE